jgi:hypothetical protein
MLGSGAVPAPSGFHYLHRKRIPKLYADSHREPLNSTLTMAVNSALIEVNCMSFYAYGLLRLSPEDTLPPIKGIDESPVFAFRSDKYSMLVSRLDRDYRFTPKSIAEHWQVIARAFEGRTVLPMRVGTFFRTEMQIVELIRQNRQELVESFCKLRGKAEMRMKVLIGAAAAAPAKPAARKSSRRAVRANGLAALLPTPAAPDADPRSLQMATQAAAHLKTALNPLDGQILSHRMEGPQCQVDVVHLIDVANAAAYQRFSQALLQAGQKVELRVSGPWPPCHFMPLTIKPPKASLSMSRPSLRTIPRSMVRAVAAR